MHGEGEPGDKDHTLTLCARRGRAWGQRSHDKIVCREGEPRDKGHTLKLCAQRGRAWGQRSHDKIVCREGEPRDKGHTLKLCAQRGRAWGQRSYVKIVCREGEPGDEARDIHPTHCVLPHHYHTAGSGVYTIKAGTLYMIQEVCTGLFTTE